MCIYCGQEETSWQQLHYNMLNSINSRSVQKLVTYSVFGVDLLLESGLVMVVKRTMYMFFNVGFLSFY